jgi:hypothetical protein
LGDLADLVIGLAKLPLDLAQLLAQVVLSLLRRKRLLRLIANLLRQPKNRERQIP